MAGGYLVIAGLLILLNGVGEAQAQTNSNAPSRLDFSNFRIISDRNIFNPRRSAGYVRSQQTSTRSSVPKKDSFALVGTMSYDAKGPLAFFEGTSSDYHKVVKPMEKIAEFTVSEIGSSAVKLTSASNQISLPVGMELNHENGTWRVGERNESSMVAGDSGRSSRGGSYNGRQRGGGDGVARTSVTSTNVQVTNSPALADDAASRDNAGDTPESAVNPEPSAAPAGNENDVLERLRRRAAAERGENSQ